MKKLLFASILLLFLLSACGSESLVSATFENYPAGTDVAQATIAPIKTSFPTAEPTPTEIPPYIGKNAEEVNALQEQCLSDNPGSLCLPLPFEPEINGQIVESEYAGQIFYQYAIPIPAGTEIVSSFDGEFSIEGMIAGSTEIRFLDQSRSVGGLSSISLQFDPFGIYNSQWTVVGQEPSEPNYQQFPFAGFVIAKDYSCLGKGDYPPLEEADFSVAYKSGKISSGDILGTANVEGLCLFINHNFLTYGSFRIYGVDGSYADVGGDLVVSRFSNQDLLRDEFGSIVFVLPN